MVTLSTYIPSESHSFPEVENEVVEKETSLESEAEESHETLESLDVEAENETEVEDALSESGGENTTNGPSADASEDQGQDSHTARYTFEKNGSPFSKKRIDYTDRIFSSIPPQPQQYQSTLIRV